MHDISVQDSSNSSGHGLNAIDLILGANTGGKLPRLTCCSHAVTGTF